MSSKLDPFATFLKEKFISNRFTFLFVFLILFLIISSVFENTIVPRLIFLLVMISVLRTLQLKPMMEIVLVSLPLIASVSAHRFDLMNDLSQATHLIFMPGLLYVLFMVIAISLLTKKVFSEKNITHDTVQGGITIYLLMGMTFAMIYGLISNASPGAIDFGSSKKDLLSLLYFSFVTLCTVGFGDIVAIHPFARSIVIIEALLGQIFLTVFIARLVGFHIAKNARS